MRARRVVTGNNGDGKSVVVSDAQSPRTHVFEHVPGQEVSIMWGTEAGHPHPDSDTDPAPSLRAVMPDRPDSTVIQMVQLPPDSVMASPDLDGAAAMAELAAISPGLFEFFEPDAPGFHTTHTTDYVIMIEGDLVLELDDGEQVAVGPGDVVVQNGTRHAWRNTTDRPATFVAVGVGRP
jgi:mannose-6-phosphate isomerase-like protein (cupin superfamily)